MEISRANVTYGSDPFVTSVHESPTVDDELGPRHEVGGQQIANGAGNVGRRPNASEWDPVDNALEAGGIAVIRREDGAWVDQVDAVAWRK